MKKAIHVTLNGILFEIEEDGYKKLNDYLESIKTHYHSQDEGAEILIDIESGIAEKFSEKLSPSKKYISQADVEDVIKVMGTVEEITEEAEEESKTGSGENAKSEEPKAEKRFYRNTDDTVLAGVASGIASYFNIDPLFVRLAFILLIFAHGLGILLYLVLWLIVPKAETNTQKLEMRGRPVNLAEIQEVVKEKSRMVKEEGEAAFEKLKTHKNLFYKILNFPIMVIEKIFHAMKKVFSVLLPALSIFFGVIFIIGALAAVLGLLLAAGLLLFNIHSPYIISDIPLDEFTNSIFYQVGVASVFLIAAIPVIFLYIFGLALVRRKNTFHAVSSGVLVGLWMVAVTGAAVVGADLTPRVAQKIEDARAVPGITKTYDYEGIKSLRIGGHGEVAVTKGEKFSFQATGQEDELAKLQFKVTDGELQVVPEQRFRGLCIFCFDKPVKYSITMPELDSFIAFGSVKASVSGFDGELRINAGEAAKVETDFSGAVLKSYIAGVSGRLELKNSPKKLEITLEGGGRFVAESLRAEEITINQSVFSKVTLAGVAKKFTATTKDHSRLNGFNLKADELTISASDFSRAEIFSTKILKMVATDQSKIDYMGPAEDINEISTEDAEIKRAGY